jgi:hypothetical protein
MHCDEADVAAYFKDLKRLITGAPVSDVCNADEAGFHELGDVTRHRVIVHAEFTDDKIDIPISRADSRASVIACIAADGHLLTPMVIVPRKTVEIELYESGFVPYAYSSFGEKTVSAHASYSNDGALNFSFRIPSNSAVASDIQGQFFSSSMGSADIQATPSRMASLISGYAPL